MYNFTIVDKNQIYMLWSNRKKMYSVAHPRGTIPGTSACNVCENSYLQKIKKCLLMLTNYRALSGKVGYGFANQP